MPKLARKVKDITTVAEAHRDLYTEKKEKDEVVYLLTEIEGHDAPDILKTVRTEAGTLRVENKNLKEKFAVFEDMDLDAVQAALLENEALKAEKDALGTKDSKLIDTAVAAKLKIVTAPLEARLTKAEKERDTYKTESEQLKQSVAQRSIIDNVVGAFVELGVADHVYRGEDSDGTLWARNRFVLGEDGNVTDKKTGLAPKDLIAQMRDEGQRPHWFGATGGTGSQAPNGSNPGKNPWMPGAAWNSTEQSLIQGKDPVRAQALANAAGCPDMDAPHHPKDQPREFSQY